VLLVSEVLMETIAASV